MTKNEAKAFIRRICGDLDEGLEELKQIDTARDALAAAVVQRVAEAYREGAATREHIKLMVETLDGDV